CAWWVFKAYEDRYGTSGAWTTMSVINCSMLASNLCPAINTLAQKGIHEISTYRATLQSAANSAKDWQGYNWQKDLVHFCQNIVATIPPGEIEDAAQAVLDAGQSNPNGMQYGDPAWQHDRAILIHNQNANENGITIYVADPPYNNLYNTMTFVDTNWDEFYKVLWGSDANSPNNEPSVVIDQPVNGGIVVINITAIVSGTASDSDGTVQRVDVAVGTQHWEAATGTDTWTYDWNTTGWEPGWHTVMARSYDGQDFSDVVVHDVEIIVDPPPVATLFNPAPAVPDTIVSGVVLIDWTATDLMQDDATLDVTLEYSTDSGSTWHTIFSGVDNNAPPYPWDTAALP
ncbi:MAG: hypothetical protein KAX31_07750, partial [Thermoplasmata archaeon]|nr:hypothetical protein [Thermoplasmata archaeon]